LEPLVAFGRRRVHQGVSLPSLLQAFRTGSRVLWDVLLESANQSDEPQRAPLLNELLFRVSPYILYHFDLMGRTIGQAYSEEQQQRARWRERLQHELCGVIFSHPDDSESFREHTLALGLDANAAHLAIAVRLGSQPKPRIAPEANLDKLMSSVKRVLSLERINVLHALRNGHLLLWVPMAAGESASESERRYATLCDALPGSGHDVVAIGIGLPDTGARGWRRSSEQALRALDLGHRIDANRAVQRYVEVALDDALHNTDSVVRYFDSLMERLAPEPQLLRTLQVFFEHRQHRKVVAGELNIHPNTLSYRLERIETILGARLDDIGWLSRLHAALRLRQLSQNIAPH
jgi:sugar diacid utilization regulator